VSGPGDDRGAAALDEVVRDLTLLLLYLTSWEEGPDGVRRSWKGFRFEALDDLADAGLISDSKRAKSVWLTEAGVERVRALQARFGLEFPRPSPAASSE
jgi:Domain of unknown function (DUF6429)